MLQEYGRYQSLLEASRFWLMKNQIHPIHKTIRGEEERMELVEKKSGLDSSGNLLGRAQEDE